jgi:hypothetical protein
MRKALRASVLLLALTGSVYAGEIPTPPAPQPPNTVTGQTTDGEMQTPREAESELVTETLRALLESLLALL